MAIAGSNRCQKELRLSKYEQDLHLFLSPFDQESKTSRELRIFVYKNKVTAISQYSWYNPKSDFSDKTDEELTNVAQKVLKFHEVSVGPAWKAAGILIESTPRLKTDLIFMRR